MRQYVQARRSLKQLTDVIVHTVIAKAQEYVLGKPFTLCFIQHPNCKTVARQLHLKSDLHYIAVTLFALCHGHHILCCSTHCCENLD